VFVSAFPDRNSFTPPAASFAPHGFLVNPEANARLAAAGNVFVKFSQILQQEVVDS
jgi:hypothetical protein